MVFADIGTSIYYVPGLLFEELGGRSPSPAAPFVLATGLAFILLALKYVEVSARYPDGGGVVSVASDAFGPMIGCLGGMLICVDYFLTGAISSVSGFQYLSAAFPALEPWLVPGACAAVAFLGVLNIVGIRESAILTARAGGRLAAGEPGGAGGGGGAAGPPQQWRLVLAAVHLGPAPAAGAAAGRASPAPGWRSRGWSPSARSRPPCASRASAPPCGR